MALHVPEARLAQLKPPESEVLILNITICATHDYLPLIIILAYLLLRRSVRYGICYRTNKQETIILAIDQLNAQILLL